MRWLLPPPRHGTLCVVALACGMAAAACGCGVRQSSRTVPALAVEIEGDDDAAVAGAQVHFGPVLVATQAERTLVVRGAGGQSTLHVSKTETSAGFASAFAVETASAESGHALVVTLRFLANRPGPAIESATVQVADDSGAVGSVAILMTGTVLESCERACASFDFAAVAVGDGAVRTAHLRNPGATPWKVRIASPPAGAFARAEGFAAGEERTMPGGGADASLEVPFEFRPTQHGDAAAEVDWPAPAGCGPRPLTLTGFGVSTTLSCEPAIIENGRPVCRVDFGLVERSAKAQGRVLLRNTGSSDVTVDLGAFGELADGTTQFSSRPGALPIRVPPGGEAAPIELEVTTSATGWFAGTLELVTNDPSCPRVRVDLRGGAVGPKVDVTPQILDFGLVSVTDVVHAQIAVGNAGLARAGAVATNLLLAKEQGGSWVETRPERDGSEAFSLLWPPDGYGPAGIPVDASARLTVVFAPASFGRHTGTITVHSNDPAHPSTQVTVTGVAAMEGGCALEVAPAGLDFGALESGESLTLPLYAHNASANPAEACLLSSFDLSAFGPEGSLTIVEAPAAVLGGETQRVWVRFAPKCRGDYSGELRFATSDPLEPSYVVPVRAECAAVSFTVVPRDVEMRVDDRICATGRVVSLINSGSSRQVIESVEFDSENPEQFFAVSSPFPATISAGEQRIVGFTLKGIAALGEYSGVARVKVSGFASPLALGLRARVSKTAVWTDEAPPRPPLDILLIVDDGPTMADKQSSLGRNFASFIHFMAQQLFSDFHVGVTTTSVGGLQDTDGRLLPVTGPAAVFTASTPNLEQKFSQLLGGVGTSGNSNPKLLMPVQLALSEPLLSGHNAGFYRPDAELVVFVLSASADQDTTPAADYEAFLRKLKGQRGPDVTVSAVIPLNAEPEPGCTYATSDAGTSLRVRELVQHTGGTLDDVCYPDWSKSLERIVPRADWLKTVWLSHPPDLTWAEPFAVEVDGLPSPHYGGRGEELWWYDSYLNAIDFEPMPRPGSNISVTYHIACGS